MVASLIHYLQTAVHFYLLYLFDPEVNTSKLSKFCCEKAARVLVYNLSLHFCHLKLLLHVRDGNNSFGNCVYTAQSYKWVLSDTSETHYTSIHLVFTSFLLITGTAHWCVLVTESQYDNAVSSCTS